MKKLDIGIKGIQEAQEGNARHIAALRPSGSLGRAIQYGTIEAQRYAVSVTHVMTGSLRGSHRMEVSGLHGKIYLDPASVNPVTGGRPADYGLREHAKGGSHAFYERTEREAGRRIAEAAGQAFIQGLR